MNSVCYSRYVHCRCFLGMSFAVHAGMEARTEVLETDCKSHVRWNLREIALSRSVVMRRLCMLLDRVSVVGGRVRIAAGMLW